MMETEQTIKSQHMKQRVDATDADMFCSTFTDVGLSGAKFDDMNLSGVRISNANLTGASIVDSATDGMTINGIAVSDLLSAYRASRAGNK
jgi:uncharacterized protein YjbI with pentapeptide repeats